MLRIVGPTLALTLACLAGCAKAPQVVYEPPVSMDDLAPGLSAPDNNYALLGDMQTSGRFACPLAIAKFASRDHDDGPQIDLVAARPREQAYWTEQLRGIAAVREVIFLSPLTTRPNGSGVPNLCATARRLGAPLLLVYAPNGLGPNSAQVFGVLWDTAAVQPLATLHASSQILDDDGQEESPNDERGDHRDQDARYQAQRSFEHHLFACLRELIERDTPAPTTQPHRWEKPLVERWWIRTRP